MKGIHASKRRWGQFITTDATHPHGHPQFPPNSTTGKWTILRPHRSYGQKWGTKRSARRHSFRWYDRRPSNSNRETNARQCGAVYGIFFVFVFLPSREVETSIFFLECRTSGKEVIHMTEGTSTKTSGGTTLITIDNKINNS